MFGKLTLWRSAIVRQPACELTQDNIENSGLVWLPDPGRWSFRADPFGLWRDRHLHIFVERFDHSDRRGRIEVLTYDESFQLVSVETALKQPWHLSYPFVFEAEEATWMLPESAESGELTLYRCTGFPSEWVAELTIAVVPGAVDATPLLWNERWWLFYAVRQTRPFRAYQLHIAYADRIGGPWKQHRQNPVRVGVADCRPAGTPIVSNDHIDLPVQDGRNTYGGAVQRLRITALDEHRFNAESQAWLAPTPKWAPFDEGLHTVSAAGPVSLIDFKRSDGSLAARVHNSIRLRG